MKYKILLIIFLVSLASSIMLSIYNNDPNSTFCNTDGGCKSVQNSKYGYLFGVSNSLYGVFIFTALSLLTFAHIKNPKPSRKLVINSAAAVGFLIAFYFIFLQVFILKAFCKFCLVIDAGMIMAFVLIAPELLKRK